MLDWDVQVRNDPGFPRDQLDQAIRQTRGVDIQEAVPGHGGSGEQRLEEVGQRGRASPRIPAVVPQVLRHQVDLLRPLRLEQLRLAHQALQRLGAVFPPHQRDGAERARVIAALGDLQVAHVDLVAQELADAGVGRHGVVDQAALGQGGYEVVEVRESEKQVDLGDLLRQLPLVALDQAADGDDRFHAALRLEARGRQDRIDRLLLGGVDESAGVDEDHVGVWEVRGHDRAVPHEVAHQALGVDGRLVAAERDDAELHPR